MKDKQQQQQQQQQQIKYDDENDCHSNDNRKRYINVACSDLAHSDLTVSVVQVKALTDKTIQCHCILINPVWVENSWVEPLRQQVGRRLAQDVSGYPPNFDKIPPGIIQFSEFWSAWSHGTKH